MRCGWRCGNRPSPAEEQERWERYQRARVEEVRRFVDAEYRRLATGQDNQSVTGFDPLRIIGVRAHYRVDFVVIGGSPPSCTGCQSRPTKDIDVTPSMAAPNLARLSAALS